VAALNGRPELVVEERFVDVDARREQPALQVAMTAGYCRDCPHLSVTAMGPGVPGSRGAGRPAVTSRNTPHGGDAMPLVPAVQGGASAKTANTDAVASAWLPRWLVTRRAKTFACSGRDGRSNLFCSTSPSARRRREMAHFSTRKGSGELFRGRARPRDLHTPRRLDPSPGEAVSLPPASGREATLLRPSVRFTPG
jgi:hypothetical protein